MDGKWLFFEFELSEFRCEITSTVMDLLIAILFCLGVSVTPVDINPDGTLKNVSQEKLIKAQTIIDNHLYEEKDGGVVIDDEVGS